MEGVDGSRSLAARHATQVGDDGEQTEDDLKLTALADEHARRTSQDGMALALEEYADLADELRTEFDSLGTFDVRNVGRAREVAKELRQRSAPQASDDEAAQAKRLRNQLWTLLQQRMGQVRRVARHAFRQHPQIARDATSSYERRQRAEARRRAKAAAAAKTE